MDPSVPDGRLLESVLVIEKARASGAPGYSYVPMTQPAGLTEMSAGLQTGVVADSYTFGDPSVWAVVEFSAEPTGTCEGIRSGGDAGRCVRQGAVETGRPGTGFENVTVYFTDSGGVRSVSSESPQIAVAGKFWATVEFVPIDEAGWFSDLLSRARSAPKI
ncbi:hypothetical protein [Actinoplanes couchii]|uniref:hypothetical protein n=1 Tax=Actinoplanes couchii TaxID=403638 RepID=UPI001944A328|nr:hypothetical protein [Actinoplanes couchii]MDR6325882.1 hypothetical protein [Actinoplanes couchii]